MYKIDSSRGFKTIPAFLSIGLKGLYSHSQGREMPLAMGQNDSIRPEWAPFFIHIDTNFIELNVHQVDRVVQYILSQREHHSGQSSQHEFWNLLIEIELDFYEKFVWDCPHSQTLYLPKDKNGL